MDYFLSCFTSCLPKSTSNLSGTDTMPPQTKQPASKNSAKDIQTSKPARHTNDARIAMARINTIMPAIRDFYEQQDQSNYFDLTWPNNNGQTLQEYLGLNRPFEEIQREIIICVLAVLNPIWPEDTKTALFSTTGYKAQKLDYAFRLKKTSSEGMDIFEVRFSPSEQEIVTEKLIAHITPLTFLDFSHLQGVD